MIYVEMLITKLQNSKQLNNDCDTLDGRATKRGNKIIECGIVDLGLQPN